MGCGASSDQPIGGTTRAAATGTTGAATAGHAHGIVGAQATGEARHVWATAIQPVSPAPTFAQLQSHHSDAQSGKLKFDVFLSHRQIDTKDFARGLKERLVRSGYRCFLDQDSLSELGDQLMSDVRASATFVLILSTNIFGSQYCAKELREALLWKLPIVLLTHHGATWEGRTWPPAHVIAQWPQELAEVFDSNLGLDHSDKYYDAFIAQLIAKIGTSQAERARGGSGGAPTLKTSATVAPAPAPDATAGANAAGRPQVTRTTTTAPTAPIIQYQAGSSGASSRPVITGSHGIELKRTASTATTQLLYATPEENPLIRAKLADPEKTLVVEESISLLTQCVQYGRVQSERAAGKHILIFIGNTGAGKSTLANYLAGCTMVEVDAETLGLADVEPVVTVLPPKDGGALAELMPIGHTKVSKTFMPHIETPPAATMVGAAETPITFADCPGFLDSRGAEINIANAVNIRAAIKAAESVRVIVLIRYHSLKADRGVGLRQMLKICGDLFGTTENLIKHADSILVGVSASIKIRLEKLQKFIADDPSEAMKVLSQRLFAFDPIVKDAETEARLPEGWSSRSALLAKIAGLKPITDHRRIFSTVLNAADESMLIKLSEGIAERIEAALKAKKYKDAASCLRHLDELSVIDHVSVERLLTRQRDSVHRAIGSIVNQFKAHCHFERFNEAVKELAELTLLDSAFVLPGLLNRAELQAYYDDCSQKAARQQQREKEFEQQLKEAQSQAAEALRLLADQRRSMETRLAEQQHQHAELIADLRSQISRTTADYDRMKADLKADMEQKLKATQADLAVQHGQNNAEMQAKLEAERQRLQTEFDAKLKAAEAKRDALLQEQQLQQQRAEKESAAQQQAAQQQLAKLKQEQDRRQREQEAAEAKQRQRDQDAKKREEEAKQQAKQQAAQPAASSVQASDDVQSIVLDCGTDWIRAGFGGDDAPRAVFPAVVGKLRPGGMLMNSLNSKKNFVGDEAQAKRGMLNLTWPIEDGIITNVDAMEAVWHHTFYNELRVAPEEHPVLASEPAENPKSIREKCTQIMFETFNTPAYYQAPSSTLIMFASGRTTGLTIDIGATTTVSPIYEGYVLPHGVKKSRNGGTAVTKYLMKLLASAGHTSSTPASPAWVAIAADIKEKLCYISATGGGQADTKNYELPDGNVISTTSERLRAPELLITPSAHSSSEPSLHHLVLRSINACDIDLRRDLASNIVLGGGSTLFEGLDVRLDKELRQAAPHLPFKIIAPPERKYSVWIGGSILASLSSFQQMWISKQEYDEFGAQIIHRKCF